MIPPEHQFAEVIVDRLLLESFANDRSPYHSEASEAPRGTERDLRETLARRLKWHVSRSLSDRQRQVVKGILAGQTERAIASELGVTQQVVHIYKKRAINKLRDLLRRDLKP